MSHATPARNDPFETLVELTAAAMTGRPPRDFVYAPLGASLIDRVTGLVARLRVPGPTPRAPASEAATARETLALQRYYRYYY
jgi:hypothetical protein